MLSRIITSFFAFFLERGEAETEKSVWLHIFFCGERGPIQPFDIVCFVAKRCLLKKKFLNPIHFPIQRFSTNFRVFPTHSCSDIKWGFPLWPQEDLWLQDEKRIFSFVFCVPIVSFSRPSRFLDLFNAFRSKTASFVVSVCALHSFAERAINFLQNLILQMRELSRCKISSCQTFSSAFRQSQFIFGNFQILPMTWFIVINFYLEWVIKQHKLL